MNKELKFRDNKVDILRALAIISIILAHSKPNNVIFQIRNFDVVLMVLLLGNSFYLSCRNKSIKYFSYVKKRFKRLVVPTWVFLTIFFCFFYGVSLALKDTYYFSASVIAHSYFFTEGIGFIWIIRVFFIVALLSPFILKISNQIKNNTLYLGLLGVGYFIYEVLMFLNGRLDNVYEYLNSVHHQLDGVLRLFYSEIVIYGMGYSLIAAFGIRLTKLSRKEINYCGGLFLVLCIGLAFLNNFSPTQAFKYPPKLYYFSYGLFVSLLLYRVLDNSTLRNALDNKFSRFISGASDWVYFWHIIFVYIITFFSHSVPFISATLGNRFLFILSSTLLITYIHKRVKKAIKPNKKNLVSLNSHPEKMLKNN